MLTAPVPAVILLTWKEVEGSLRNADPTEFEQAC